VAHPVRIRFHGVRAIHPAPFKGNQTTGGNTSCIEIIDGNSMIFVNAGYGIATVGDRLLATLKERQQSPEITILLSDFLWDSTMGLPSFSPIHDSKTSVKILTGIPINSAIAGLNDVTSNIFSPFNGFQSLAAQKEIVHVNPGFQTGRWSVMAKVNQNALTADGATIWRLKHEDGANIGVVLLCERDERTIAETSNFLEGCDTLICAATSHPDQNVKDPNRLGFSDALTIALATKTKSLILSQFHPAMNDLAIQAELLSLQQSLQRFKQSGLGQNLTIRLATELENISVPDVDLVKIAI